MNVTARLYEPAGAWYNGAALAYAVGGYVAGIAGLFSANLWINFAATLLLAHAMTIAAYLVHECGHNLVFHSMRDNTRLGRVLVWICGASYGRYEDMRYKHFRHHVDNGDIVWFDYEDFFQKHPWLLKVTRFFEWFYVPAHDLLMHFVLVFTSFIIPERRDQRMHNLVSIVLRGGIFIALLIFFPKVAILYAVAYMLMMTVLRFMDSLQHDYGYDLTLFEPGNAPRKGDFDWEQEHTFSNPHTLRSDWPNWLTLNFGFHNAHHADMKVPWYRLPEKHRQMFGDDPTVVIPLWAQLSMFHRNRVSRVVGNHEGDEPWGKDFLLAARRAEVSGGNAASFLTPF